jgi:hypothetical protein
MNPLTLLHCPVLNTGLPQDTEDVIPRFHELSISRNMYTMVERLKTPPPALELTIAQLLTPPPTGGSSKRVRFSDDPDTPKSKRFASSHRIGDFGLTDYTEVQEFSDEDLDLTITDSESKKSRCSSPPTESDTPHLDNVSRFKVNNTTYSGVLSAI